MTNKFYIFSILFLQLYGIYLFTKGFMIIKEETIVKHATHQTLPKNRSKVVMLIIDALRFDYFYYNESMISPAMFQNNFKQVHQIMMKNPDKYILTKAHSDPPTVTIHKIESMVTGNFPPYFDVTKNFGTSEITRDNIIFQMNKLNLSSILLGDYMWAQLFPTQFHKKIEVASFDVFDLDSVDNVIHDNIFRFIDEGNFELLIAHGIGVDHAGHAYGNINNSKMQTKLVEMDLLVEKIIEKIDEHTYLIVLGDHGMSNEGDHGGGSYEETTTVIFSYHKAGFLFKGNHDLSGFSVFDPEFKEKVPLINLAPTLSYILEIPIPQSNIGIFLPDFILATEIESFYQIIKQVFIENYHQLKNYIDSYLESNNFGFDGIKLYLEHISNIESMIEDETDVLIDTNLLSEIKKLSKLVYLTESIFALKKKIKS